MRVVLDTNIYVSAYALPGGLAEEAFQLAAWRRYELVTSPSILAELANVLTRKFNWDSDRALEACREIAEISMVVKPTKKVRVLKDEPDNRILECAVEAKADRIVTGDKGILRLGRYDGIRIVRLAEFLKEVA